MRVDLRGLSCPVPVTRTMQMLDRGEREMVLLVDCGAAVENVSRLLNQRGCRCKTVEHDGWYELVVEKP